ncbi:MAG: peptide chain release factor N(5)-glutamine methyltransferase [Cytophagales bacterium]|nr:peptide chain release factor N(5)-glutamine methyltransferase [Cytophagales bacterium]
MDSSFNAFQIFQSAVEKLSHTYEKEESAANVRWLMEDILGFSRMDIAMKKSQRQGQEARDQFLMVLDRVTKGEPIQYVLGYAEFLGEQYLVNSSVLIPRPETEELVLKVSQDNPQAKLILDIGTGSGCIAIGLAKSIAGANVWGWDVDPGALNVAQKNADNLNVSVQFEVVNALKAWPSHEEKFDVIVSNPPYIREEEKKDMRANVLDHEPAKALFVPNEDPLLFYREIGEKGRDYLTQGGKLYFEINEQFGAEMLALLENLGYEQVLLHKDFQDKARIVSGRWKV